MILSIPGGEPVYRRPEPYPIPAGFPNLAQVRYWFRADAGVFSDVAGTQRCESGDRVALWNNDGTLEDAQQATILRRPLFRTGGQNNMPYIEARSANDQYFSDLPGFTTPQNSITNYNGWQTGAFVFRDRSPGSLLFKSIFGATTSGGGGKAGVYLNNAGVFRFGKSQWVTYDRYDDGDVHALVLAHSTDCDFRYRDENNVDRTLFGCTNPNSNAVNALQFLRNTSIGAGTLGNWDGDLYEAILWNGAGYMSAANQALVMNYLKAKYAL